jgi:O-antigen ligase
MIYSNFYFLGNVNYYAVYLNIATILILGIMAHARFKMFTKRSKRMMYTGLFLSIALVLLLSSRAGVLAILIVLLFSVYYLSKSRYIQIFSLIFLLLGVFYITQHPRFRNYIQIFEKMLYSSEYLEEDYLLQQSALRMVFWEGAVRVIQDHTWFGVGNGDVKSSMQDVYRTMGVYDKLKTKNNPHNQFLRTFVATGIPGLTALLAFFVYGIVTGIRYRNYFLIAFLMLLAIHFFFKSMLFRIDGVVCFSFFYALLWLHGITATSNPASKDP